MTFHITAAGRIRSGYLQSTLTRAHLLEITEKVPPSRSLILANIAPVRKVRFFSSSRLKLTSKWNFFLGLERPAAVAKELNIA